MIKKHEFTILNRHCKCKGIWTRIEGEQRSVIDYAVVSEGDEDHLNEMIIDENKIFTPYHIVKERTIYSDHCAIIVK